jgi:HSP20 family molecular chaperone IbpA
MSLLNLVNTKHNAIFDPILDPFSRVDQHFEKVNKLMNGFFDDADLVGLGQSSNMYIDGMNDDFVEENGHYVMKLIIPKELVKKMKIREKNRSIIISGRGEVKSENKTDGTYSKSSFVQSFNRIARIPDDSIANSAIAKYSKGKLIITLKKVVK